MSIEANKRLVAEFNSHFERSDIDAVLSLMTEDATWWVNARADLFPVAVSGLTLYSLTKSAHLAFTRGLARELGPRNITVNLVQPGPVDTELNPADGESGAFNSSRTVLERYATTDELAAVVAFVASPAASYVTGSVLTADGGYNA